MKPLLLCLVFLFSFNSFSQNSAWNKLLQEHIDNSGWVNYNQLSENKEEIDNYLNYLNKTKPLSSWTKNATKAFWINAYNAYTIKLVLDNSPLKSILDIKENNKNAWEIPFVKVGGKTYTLNHIEHEILRKKYKDPRIHVGVNCASISCPAIPNVAFTEKNIEYLLNTGIKNFINDPERNTITSSELKLSQIFNWFKDDFTQQGDLITFINKYSSVTIDKNAVITYKEYNWKLNKQ